MKEGGEGGKEVGKEGRARGEGRCQMRRRETK